MHIDKNLHRHAVPVAVPAAFGGMDLGFAQTAPVTGVYHARIKRVFDVLAILVCLPLFLPALIVLICAVALQGGNPFFRQTRVGLGGQTFTMWKLRTMVPNADAALAAYLQANPAARAEWLRTQKLKNDPRITPLGAVLRRTSLDELPQLWNVLRGEMSLVGPRPMLPEQQGLYPGTAYYAMLPGITGLWQVSCRNESPFAERAYYDNRYHSSLSFWTDLRTLLATVRVVTRATGH